MKKIAPTPSLLIPYLLTPELLLKEITSKTELFLYYDKHLKEIVKAKPNNLKRLLKAIVYIQINNQLAANKELTAILRTDPKELYFSERNISHTDLRSHSHHFFNSIRAYLTFIQEKVQDGPLADMLVTYVSEFYPEEEQKKLLELRQNNFDKKFIIDNFSSPVWGKEFIGFWGRQSLKVMSTLEFHQQLEKNLTDSRLEQQFSTLVWIFKDFFPPRDEWRKIILRKTQAYQKSQNIFERYLFLTLLKNESIKNQLIKSDASLVTVLNSPVYQMERNLYKELLDKKIACDFALSALYQLGDDDENYRAQFKACP